MYDFSYVRPESLEAASAILAADPEATPLSGGQTLLPVLRARLASPSQLVDLGRLTELKGIALRDERIIIGAGETHCDVSANDLVRSRLPGLAHLAGGIGDPQVRHRGTIGGSVANNDPAACYPAAALALGAIIGTTRREISAEAFFTGMFATALEPGEIVTTVSFPHQAPSVYIKFPNPASRFALIGVFAAVVGGTRRIAVTGAGLGVFRWTQAETASPTALADAALQADRFTGDIHGSADYRMHLTRIMTERALAALATQI